MKVITNRNNWPKRVHCTYCKSTLEIEEKDVRYYGSISLGTNTIEVKCPCCNKDFKLGNI